MSNTTTIIPHLVCGNAAEAYTFYQKAFAAEPVGIINSPDGKVMHGSLKIDSAPFFIVDTFPGCEDQGGVKSPLELGGSPVTIHLQVADCDAVFQRAVDAGCKVQMPLDDMFWGDRYGMVIDPYGHKWSIATTLREVSPEEIEKAMAAF